MKGDQFVRVLAGTMVLVSVLLVLFVSKWWLVLTAFVGVNLIQSAFTGICPPEILFRKMGWLKGDNSCCRK